MCSFVREFASVDVENTYNRIFKWILRNNFFLFSREEAVKYILVCLKLKNLPYILTAIPTEFQKHSHYSRKLFTHEKIMMKSDNFVNNNRNRWVEFSNRSLNSYGSKRILIMSELVIEFLKLISK